MEYKKGKKITDRCQFEKGKRYMFDGENFEFSHIGEDREPHFVYNGCYYTKSIDEYNCAGFPFFDYVFYEAIEIKEELPETGLVVGDDGKTIINRTGKSSGYGFRYIGANNSFVYEKSDDWSFESDPNEWLRPATEEDEERWEELLIKEAKRRGYKKGVVVEEKWLGKKEVRSNKIDVVKMPYNYYEIRIEGWCIMFQGEWADIIEEKQEDTVEELMNRPIKDLTPYQINKVWNALNK